MKNSSNIFIKPIIKIKLFYNINNEKKITDEITLQFLR